MDDFQIKQKLGRCYIVAEYKVDKDEDYLVKMITENSLKGHLQCRISYEGSKKVLMYDISNMISLEKEYENRYLEVDDLRELFESITKVFSVGDSHLLEEKYYYLNPSYIYKDMDSNEIKFLYMPGYYEQDISRYFYLADFLLQRVNGKDEYCIQTTYKFYRMTRSDTFSIAMFMNVINKDLTVQKKAVLLETDEVETRSEIEEEDSTSVEARFIIPGILTVITAILGIAYLFFLRNTVFEMYLLALTIVMMLITLMVWTKEIYVHIKGIQEIEFEKGCDESSVEGYWNDEETVIICDEIENESTMNMESDIRIEWMGNGNVEKYNIINFPVIIGKLNNEVDCRIEDPSISRLHAKLIRRNNHIYIFDLNSTNGTKVDGKRLHPGEEIEVLDTSKIILGNVQIKLAY